MILTFKLRSSLIQWTAQRERASYSRHTPPDSTLVEDDSDRVDGRFNELEHIADRPAKACLP